MKEKKIIDPPNYIEFGTQLDAMTGQELREFYLPFDDTCTGVAWIVIGENTPSVCIREILSGIAKRFENGIYASSIQIDSPKKCEELIMDMGEIKICKYNSITEIPAEVKNSHWITCEMQEFNKFQLGNGKTIYGNIVKVHIKNVSFMPDDVFLVVLK